MSEWSAIALIKMTSEGERVKGTHGGRRAGAGRKRTIRRRGGPHRMRPELSPRHPVHVTLRARHLFPELRRRDYYAVICKVLEHYLGGEELLRYEVSRGTDAISGDSTGIGDQGPEQLDRHGAGEIASLAFPAATTTSETHQSIRT